MKTPYYFYRVVILLFVFFVVSCSVKDDPILVNIVPGANSQDAPQIKQA